VTTRPVTVVSGGSRGLGLAIVRATLDRGDRVATFSRSGSPELSALVDRHPDQLYEAKLDAADARAIHSFIVGTVARFGRIDHCVANAAIAYDGVLATMRDDEIDAMVAVNIKGAIVLVRESVRQMLVQSLEPGSWPSITLVSSIVASSGSPGLSVYAATKAAHEGFAVSLARELGPRGIRVNCVAPGFLETDLSASLSVDNRGRIARRTALGRLGGPTDVAGVIGFLASGAAAFVTGQTLVADGGG
jgi:3-oxoacyl-[acyl-carrier protein] reductase